MTGPAGHDRTRGAADRSGASQGARGPGSADPRSPTADPTVRGAPTADPNSRVVPRPGPVSPGRTTLRVTRNVSIPLDELAWRFTTSGGPGGQHANRSSTRAEVRFDVVRSSALGPRQRARLLARFGPEVRAASSSERSQSRNRDVALRRLADRLADALQVQRVRVPTAPSAASRARRLQAKRRQALRKQGRRASDDGDG